MFPTLPDRKTARPRERILLTAHALFYRHGIRSTGIDRVIAESEVAKVTFYRHFPSKHDLILAYLEARHQLWMAWFTDALRRHATTPRDPLNAIVPALGEWICAEAYQGCAFINAVGEFRETLPGVVTIARRHKQAMTDAIAELIPASEDRQRQAQALALALDGAMVRAQLDDSPEIALQSLQQLIDALRADRQQPASPLVAAKHLAPRRKR